MHPRIFFFFSLLFFASCCQAGPPKEYEDTEINQYIKTGDLFFDGEEFGLENLIVFSDLDKHMRLFPNGPTERKSMQSMVQAVLKDHDFCFLVPQASCFMDIIESAGIEYGIHFQYFTSFVHNAVTSKALPYHETSLVEIALEDLLGNYKVIGSNPGLEKLSRSAKNAKDSWLTFIHQQYTIVQFGQEYSIDESIPGRHLVARSGLLFENPWNYAPKDLIKDFFRRNPDQKLVLDIDYGHPNIKLGILPQSIKNLVIVGTKKELLGIEFGSLRGCTNLRHLEIRHLTARWIGANFLSDCPNLTYFDPQGLGHLESLGPECLSGCPKLLWHPHNWALQNFVKKWGRSVCRPLTTVQYGTDILVLFLLSSLAASIYFGYM